MIDAPLCPGCRAPATLWIVMDRCPAAMVRCVPCDLWWRSWHERRMPRGARRRDRLMRLAFDSALMLWRGRFPHVTPES